MSAAIFAYAGFLLLALVGPGVALQRALRLRVDLGLVLPLGYAFAAATYWMSLVSSVPWVFPALVLVADLLLLLPRRGLGLAPGPSVREALGPALALIAFLAVTEYPFGRTASDGAMMLDPIEAIDTAFHVGIAYQLAEGHPLEVPGFAGLRFSYHFGSDLVRAAAVRWAGVKPYDLMYCFDPTVAAVGLILALRALVAALGGSAWAVALVGWTPLATDFSFLFAGFEGAHWWADLLSSNLLLHLAVGNSLVTALAMLAGALVAWCRWQAGEGRAWAGVAAALAGALPFFKVFLAGAAACGLAFAAARRARGALALLLPSVVGMAWLFSGRAATNVVRLEPFALVFRTAQSLDLLPLGGLAAGLFAATWIFAGMGLRWWGLRRALAALRASGPAQALAVATLIGLPLGLLLRLTFVGAEGDYNVGFNFLVQSGSLLWVFTALAIPPPTRTSRRAALLALLAGAALPATLQLAWKKTRVAPMRVPAAVVRAAAALRADSQPGDVVIESLTSRYPPPSLVLAGRRVAYNTFIPYMVQFASTAEIASRENEVEEFFETSDVRRAATIAGRLGVRYLLLLGPAAPHFDGRKLLCPVFVERGVRLFRIEPSPPGVPGEPPGQSDERSTIGPPSPRR